MTTIFHHPDMEKHIKEIGKSHVECTFRTKVISEQLKKDYEGKCSFKLCRPATTEELEVCHGNDYIAKVQNSLGDLTEPDPDMYYNDHTYNSALLASGGAIQLMEEILDPESDTKSGFAVVRPPGHHAFSNKCSGFCYFNNALVGAFNILKKDPTKKILVIDWDVHYHLGSEEIVLNSGVSSDNLVVYSIHRYDNGRFYPGSKNGRTGVFHEGRIINDGLNEIGTDKIYLEKITNIVNLFKEDKPDLLVISCGFDAAKGDPLGGFKITPEGYKNMVKQLKTLTKNIAIVLEGGYNLQIIPKCASKCVEGLLEE